MRAIVARVANVRRAVAIVDDEVSNDRASGSFAQLPSESKSPCTMRPLLILW